MSRALADPVYANGAALVLNALAASALGFAFWLVAARRFPAEELGWGAAFVSAATLAALVGRAGFDAAIIRFAPHADAATARRLLLASTIAATLLTTAVVGVMLALAGRGVDSLAPLRAPPVAAGFLLLACGISAAWMLDAFFIAEQAAVFTLVRNVAFNLVKLLVIALAFTVPMAWGAGLVVSLAVALMTVPFLLARRRAGVTRPEGVEVGAYAAKTYVLNVAEFLPGLLLPLIVLETLGPATNARFYLAWTVATVGFLVSKAIAQSAFAALVRDSSPRASIAKGARLSALVLLPFALALLAAPQLPLRAFGIADAEAQALLQLLALSFVPVCATNLFLAYLKARRAGWELTLLPGATLLALLVATPAGLLLGGLRGVGIAWLAIQTIAGLYAAARLHSACTKRTPHAPRTYSALRRRAHEG